MARQTMDDLRAKIAEHEAEIERLKQRLGEARESMLRLEASLGLIGTLVSDAQIKR